MNSARSATLWPRIWCSNGMKARLSATWLLGAALGLALSACGNGEPRSHTSPVATDDASDSSETTTPDSVIPVAPSEPTDVDSEEPTPTPLFTSLMVAPVRSWLVVGETRRLYTTGMNLRGLAENADLRTTLRTADDAVATVAGAVVTAVGPGTTTITASAGGLVATASVVVVAADPTPSDPASVAPAIDPTVVSSIDRDGEFLYSGTDPMQHGLDAVTIDPMRAAIVRGRAFAEDGSALPEVEITVLAHPELGRTKTRADGAFDMMVNGGGALTLRYSKPGYLRLDRQIEVPWQDFVTAPDVVLIAPDNVAGEINLTLPELQVARATAVSDGDGERQATLAFMPGTLAVAEYADGTLQALPMLHVRATEYTVGERGPARMPAVLPPMSAYTYAIELAADEAVDASRVIFSRPVVFYLENFLALPDNIAIPLGFYDRERGVWAAAEDGVTLRILGVEEGLAVLDITGDGVAEDREALAVFDITDMERARLSTLYHEGQSIWRFLIPHFTPWDCNAGAAQPPDAEPPPSTPPTTNEEEPPEEEEDEDCCKTNTCAPGSLIGCRNGTLGESLPLVGARLTLNYTSERAPGAHRVRLTVPLSGNAVPASVERIDVEVQVAGHVVRQSFAPLAGQNLVYDWDRTDAYGRAPQGPQPFTVRTSYVYRLQYVGFNQAVQRATSFAKRLGESGTSFRIAGWARPGAELSVDRMYRGTMSATLGGFDSRAAARLGGWTINAHHVYDPRTRALYRGDGSQMKASAWTAVVPTVAGVGTAGFGGDGGKATAATFNQPRGMAMAPDGSLYIADSGNHVIRRIGPAGIITTIAGTAGVAGYGGDGGPAIAAMLASPASLAFGPDGSLYFNDTGNFAVRRIDASGDVSTVAGTGTSGCICDEGGCGVFVSDCSTRPTGCDECWGGWVAYESGTQLWRCPCPEEGTDAAGVDLGELDSLAVGRDGSVYFGENRRLRRLSPEGELTEISGAPSVYGGLTLTPDGSLLIVDGWSTYRVYRMDASGNVTPIAGSGLWGALADGGPALESSLSGPRGVALGRDGSLYIGDQHGLRVRRVYPSGRILTTSGRDVYGASGNNGPASRATFAEIVDLAMSPDGRLFVLDRADHRARAIAPAYPTYSGMAAGETLIADGAVVHGFDFYGRHRATYSMATGVALHRFGYDYRGYLASVLDRDGNATTINRYGYGFSISAAGRSPTTALLDAYDGHLASLTNPAGETTRLAHGTTGLLTGLTRPRNDGDYSFTYTSLGKLTADADPAGGKKSLARANGTAALSTAMGVTRTHAFAKNALGVKTATSTFGTGARVETAVDLDGTSTTTFASGAVMTRTVQPDPRFGMQAPVVSSHHFTLPSGAGYSVETERDVILADAANPLSVLQQTERRLVNGRMYTTTYNAETRTRSAMSPMGRVTQEQLDDHGRVIERRAAGLAPVLYEYDGSGRAVSIIQGSRSVVVRYDDLGRPTRIMDSLLRPTALAYDGADRVTGLVLPGDRTLTLARDANGAVTSVTPPGKPAHTLGRTPVDLVSSYSPPGVGAVPATPRGYSFDVDRRPIGLSRSDGRSLVLTYDQGRPGSVTTDRGTTTVSYQSASNRIASIVAPDGASLAYDYDGPLALATYWSGEVSGNVSRTYDAKVQLVSEAVNNGAVVSFAYDDDRLPTAVGDLALTRDPASGRVTATTVGSVVDRYLHNEHGEVTSHTASFGSTLLFAASYERDDLGRLTAVTETIDGATHTFEYGYDAAGFLATVATDGVVAAAYAYDANGNRQSATTAAGHQVSLYDERDQIISFGDVHFEHSPDGELVEKSDAAGTTTYTYDTTGALREVTLPDGRLVELVLDAGGRRVGKSIDGELVSRRLYGQSLEVLADLNPQGVVSRYVYLDPQGAPAYMVKAGHTYRIVSDGLGSPRLVVNATSGEVVARLDYDAWGNIIRDTQPGFIPFAFAGREWDAELGLYYMRARYYDPMTGRFISADPLRLAAGTNFYRYASNLPHLLRDPYGLSDGGESEGFWSHVGHWIKDVVLKSAGTVAEFFGDVAEAPLGPAVGVAVEVPVILAEAAIPTMELIKIRIKEQQGNACGLGSGAWCPCYEDPSCWEIPKIPLDPREPIPDPPNKECDPPADEDE